MKKSTANRMALFRSEGGANLTRRQKQLRDMEFAEKLKRAEMNGTSSESCGSFGEDEIHQLLKKKRLLEDSYSNSNSSNSLFRNPQTEAWKAIHLGYLQPPIYQPIVGKPSSAPSDGPFDSLLALAAAASELESFSNSSASSHAATTTLKTASSVGSFIAYPTPTPTLTPATVKATSTNPITISQPNPMSSNRNMYAGQSPRPVSIFHSRPMLPRINFDKVDKKFDFQSLHNC